MRTHRPHAAHPNTPGRAAAPLHPPSTMRNISIGVRLSCTVISIFVAFSIAFIVFQQYREKEFKIDSL